MDKGRKAYGMGPATADHPPVTPPSLMSRTRSANPAARPASEPENRIDLWSASDDPDGDTLDIYNSAVAEMIIYLYAYANDFDGGMSWMLSDWPVPLMDHSAHWISKSRQDYEADFGMYAFDGTETGRPKPVVHAMKFFHEYLETSPEKSGSLRLVETDTQTGCGYIYENANALFVGMQSFANENIHLNSPPSSYYLI